MQLEEWKELIEWSIAMLVAGFFFIMFILYIYKCSMKNNEIQTVQPELTLRDQFAMSTDLVTFDVLHTLKIKTGRTDITIQEMMDYSAQLRYLYADAMLIERAKEQK